MNKYRISFFLIALLGLIFQSNAQETTDKDSLEDIKSGYFQYACFYHLDDKTTVDSLDQIDTAWQLQKEQEFRDTAVRYDLFDHQGGGPNGAEWNGAGALCFAVYFPGLYDGAKVRLSLNDSVRFELTIQDEFAWLLVPESQWQSILKPMTKDAIHSFFTEREIIGQRRALQKRAYPLDTGECLRFTFDIDGNHVSQYLHFAFGE